MVMQYNKEFLKLGSHLGYDKYVPKFNSLGIIKFTGEVMLYRTNKS